MLRKWYIGIKILQQVLFIDKININFTKCTIETIERYIGNVYIIWSLTINGSEDKNIVFTSLKNYQTLMAESYVKVVKEKTDYLI